MTIYILKNLGKKPILLILAYKKGEDMNAFRKRTIKKRYPKRIEGEMRFAIYMKKFLSDMKISC